MPMASSLIDESPIGDEAKAKDSWSLAVVDDVVLGPVLVSN
jgi:hypothetical protein